jgi:hypothetical protein
MTRMAVVLRRRSKSEFGQAEEAVTRRQCLINALTGQVNFVDCARANTRIPEFETNQWVSTEVIEKKLQKQVARPRGRFSNFSRRFCGRLATD